jgi:sugar (pentulose or hexulose) kinase
VKSGGKVYLGFDLGASSGRAVVGALESGRLCLEQISRFANTYLELDGTFYWDFLELWSNVVASMQRCAQAGHSELAGIAVDTWGVDYGLIGSDGKLIGQPICYRDDSTQGVPKLIASKMPRRQIYDITGIQLGRVASLPQLLAIKNGPGKDRLRIARHFLMMPGLFRYFLCGDVSVELSAAGSTGCKDPKRGSRRSEKGNGLGSRARLCLH